MDNLMPTNRTIGPWIPDNVPTLQKAIAQRALMDVGLCENPPGSNRSGRIDEYNLAVGAPVGSYWCASAAAAWFKEVGADVPKGAASCDNWLTWAQQRGTFSQVPQVGSLVLYGVPGDAHHCGVVVRTEPYLLSVEGNTTVSGFSRNGEFVALKAVDKTRVLGYIAPRGKI